MGLDVGNLFGWHAEFLGDLFGADAALVAGHRIEHHDAGAHQLHEVLVARDDRHVGACLQRDARISRNQVVGLEAFLLDRDHPESTHGVAHKRELRHQLVRRFRAVALVVGIDLVAEALAGIVENHRHVGRHDAAQPLPQQFPQHVAEGEHRACWHAVRARKAAAPALRSLEHGEIRTENE
jgi:hypothetical protein